MVVVQWQTVYKLVKIWQRYASSISKLWSSYKKLLSHTSTSFLKTFKPLTSAVGDVSVTPLPSFLYNKQIFKMLIVSLPSVSQSLVPMEASVRSQHQKMENLISQLNCYKLIPYLVDRCICPAPCRSRQMLEKNILSWALAGTGSVLFTRQVAV